MVLILAIVNKLVSDLADLFLMYLAFQYLLEEISQKFFLIKANSQAANFSAQAGAYKQTS